jgi:NADPH2:quinone reductase
VTGDPEVLKLVDSPIAEPGPGEVRVRIHRSGVNPTDWKSRRGSEPGTPVDPAQVPNQDGAGIVDAVGQGVEASLEGLRVWIWEAAHERPRGGTAQEYAVVPRPNVVFLPDSGSYDLGVSLSMVPNARWQFVLLYTSPDHWRARALDDLSTAVEDGALRVGSEAGLPVHHYPLDQAAQAHAAVEAGAIGKVLIDVR